MPKNIYLPKENFPKVEEIREINNEIPTYEEFINNYEQDQVNYEDLTHEDINSNKGYGPMWGNSQYGERWINLRIPCPVSGCGNTTITNQTHSCGGQVEISNKARIKCRSCGDVSHVRSWNFSCSNHGGGHTDMASFTDALIIALDNGDMNRSVVAELLQHLRSSW